MQEQGETPPLDWLEQLRLDSAEARTGGLAEVAREMAQAKADFFAEQAVKGLVGRPHPDAIPKFLGLAGRPEQGLHMALRVLTSWLEGFAPKPEWEELTEELEETGGG